MGGGARRGVACKVGISQNTLTACAFTYIVSSVCPLAGQMSDAISASSLASCTGNCISALGVSGSNNPRRQLSYCMIGKVLGLGMQSGTMGRVTTLPGKLDGAGLE